MKNKSTLTGLVLAAFTGLFALSACATPVTAQQTSAPPHTISVNGSGIAYGKPDIAARLLESGRATLAAPVAAAMERGLAAIAASRLGIGRLHSAIDWLGRRV